MSNRIVLIVEDEADCAATLEMALEALPSVSTRRVASAEAALKALAMEPAALVISDLQLPGKSGLELMAGVSGVPVVIVSASVDAGIRETALRMGAAAFFAKPFSPSAVCEKVSELLSK